MKTQTKYETGATSHAVNDLILFTDNTRELAEYRDKLYRNAINDKHDLTAKFLYLHAVAMSKYCAEFGREDSQHILKMTQAEINEFCQLYANDFENWKKEHSN